jgi:hypothetical protein
VRRGAYAAGTAAAVGLVIAVGLAAAAWLVFPASAPGVLPFVLSVSGVIGPMFACAGWLAYGPAGYGRFTAALAGLFLISFMVLDAMSVALRGNPYLPALITVGAQVVATSVLTAFRVRRTGYKTAEPVAGSDGG